MRERAHTRSLFVHAAIDLDPRSLGPGATHRGEPAPGDAWSTHLTGACTYGLGAVGSLKHCPLSSSKDRLSAQPSRPSA